MISADPRGFDALLEAEDMAAGGPLHCDSCLRPREATSNAGLAKFASQSKTRGINILVNKICIATY